jgi:hypothetical protein
LTSYLSYYTNGIIAHGTEDVQQVIQSGMGAEIAFLDENGYAFEDGQF